VNDKEKQDIVQKPHPEDKVRGNSKKSINILLQSDHCLESQTIKKS
jgi:hypothetical protein